MMIMTNILVATTNMDQYRVEERRGGGEKEKEKERMREGGG